MVKCKKVNEDFLFVYGTLRRYRNNEMAQFLASTALYIGPGCYQGKLYNISEYPGVIPSNHAADQVQGDVYRLIHSERLLAELDVYEECGPGFPDPTEYVRTIQVVRLNSGETIPAWIYLYNWPIDHLDVLPSSQLLTHKIS